MQPNPLHALDPDRLYASNYREFVTYARKAGEIPKRMVEVFHKNGKGAKVDFCAGSCSAWFELPDADSPLKLMLFGLEKEGEQGTYYFFILTAIFRPSGWLSWDWEKFRS